MELEEIKRKLREIGLSLSGSTDKIDCYLFGSVLSKEAMPNDIDLLVVYQHASQLIGIKRQFVSMSREYPLHIIYLNFAEEREFNFISEQNGLKVFGVP